jgi:DNA-binding NtrC family response regulator
VILRATGMNEGPLIDPVRAALLSPLAKLAHTNPFEPAWDALLASALGGGSVTGVRAAGSTESRSPWGPEALGEPLAQALAVIATQLAQGKTASEEERAIYQGAALYGLAHGFGPRLQALIDHDTIEVPFYDDFVEQHRFLFAHPGLRVPEPSHLLALLYQTRRAWSFASTKIRGRSAIANAVRASLWRANLGSDLGAYADGLFRRMDEIPVLITGETGTGKELAAACIGWSRYIPFDPVAKRFATTPSGDYHARNLCEVPSSLLESALFGHKRGSFTGAAADAKGYFALPKPHGSLFLDEIGELPEHVQVKLLRPLQSREYLPLGESRPHTLSGRQLFATHRDLEALCREGKFRADLLERMNGVPIRMPSLRQVLAEAPEELHAFVRGFVADKIDDAARVEEWSARVVRSIEATRRGYAWPRNLRELKNYAERFLLTDGRMEAPEPSAQSTEQRAATPETTALPSSALPSGGIPSSGILGPRAKAGEVSLEELTRTYVTRVHVLTAQNKAETARRTGLDWRTVKKWVDPARLGRWLARKK